MNIKDFPKELNPSQEDLVLIQSSNGITKHAKIGDFPGSNQEDLIDAINVVDAKLVYKASIEHQHSINDIDGLLGELQFSADQFNSHVNFDAVNQHEISAISGLQDVLNNKADVNQIGNERKFISSSPPVNPLPGTIWIEVTTDNRVVEEWTFINNRWAAPKNFSMPFWTSTGGALTAMFSLNPQYDYLITKISMTIFYVLSPQKPNAIIYVEGLHYKSDGLFNDTNVGNKFSPLFRSSNYTNRVIGDIDLYENLLNLIIISAPKQMLSFAVTPSPHGSTQYRFNGNLDYFLLRKEVSQ